MIEKLIPQLVEKHAQGAIQLAQELVRINTVNPYSGEGETTSERSGQLFLQKVLDSLGAATRLFDCPPDVYEQMDVLGPENRNFADRPNLVGEFTFGTGEGKTIVINGHMDTVGVSGMTIDPFSGELKDCKVWGRGSSDCKGCLAAGVLACKALLEASETVALNGRIIFESVVEEECNGGGAGTLACCLEGYRGDAAIVVDGSGLEILFGCNGVVTADILVRGRGGHAARGNAINAIDKGVIVKEAIDDFKASREERYPDTKVNLGIFHSGTLPAVVPGEARLSLNITYTVEEAKASEAAGKGWNGRAVCGELELAVLDKAEKDEWLKDHKPEISWVKDLPPYEITNQAWVVKEIEYAYRKLFNKSVNARRLEAWGDAAWLAVKGNMPTIMFSPGKEGTAHAAAEYIEVQDMIDSAKVIALALANMLAESDS